MEGCPDQDHVSDAGDGRRRARYGERSRRPSVAVADLLRSYTDAGGRGPKLAQVKVCWDDDVERARDLAFHLWPTSGLEGELSQELPTPRHFEQAVSVLKREDVVSSFPCGRDPQPH